MNYFIKTNEGIIKELNFRIDECPALHEDMHEFWNKRTKETMFTAWKIEEVKYDEYLSQFINKQNIHLTCDYVGPSTYIAQEKRGLSTAEVLAYYIPSREFGGHMIWPSKEFEIRSNSTTKKSINTARSYCFKERIDYTLYGIKQWYEESDTFVVVFKNVLDGNCSWLKQFKNFKGFIDFFMFNAFVNDNYDVYDLSSYKNVYTAVISGFPAVEFTTSKEYPDNLIKAYIPEKYSHYIDGCLVAIKNRSNDIDNFMSRR